jgi:hypothetical protein
MSENELLQKVISIKKLLIKIMQKLRSERYLYEIDSSKTTFIMAVRSKSELRLATTLFVGGGGKDDHNYGTFDISRSTWNKCAYLCGFKIGDKQIYIYFMDIKTLNMIMDNENVCEDCVHKFSSKSEPDELWKCYNSLSKKVIRLLRDHKFNEIPFDDGEASNKYSFVEL